MPALETTLLLARDCSGDDCEKPTSTFLKSGVPGIIIGVLVLAAAGVCCYFLWRNKKRDALEAKAAREWN
ncbi:uncharacterized protein LDX57_004336 [Aspergillus melleus]|uniref:uncharacterized protein n=1 Tax=Aspergillus melleus TaxID=138277 RepID=UPI001E8D1D4B|nr:uncharacterized protein LDX57_004336 [Aspergillus melleus]KAH8426601.1 hypothetical protein LDX57_004336 [Aspergillus melleus]